MIPLHGRMRAALSAQPGRGVRGVRLARADGLMIGAMLVWGANITWIKAIVRVVPALGFGTLRYALAAAVLVVLLCWREGSPGARRRDLASLILVGVVGLGCYQLAFLLGIPLISASLSAILLATTPLQTAAIAALWTREPLQPRGIAALAVSFAGVVVVIVGGGTPSAGSWAGGLLMLAAALAIGLSAILARPPLQVYSSLRVTTYMCVFGSLTLLPFGLPSLMAAERAFLNPLVVGALAFTALLGTVLGNLAWNYAIQQLGATRTAAYTYLQPVIAVAIAAVLLGEHLAPPQVLGSAAVVLGLVLYPRPAAVSTGPRATSSSEGAT